eukprot:418849-Amphidinium_carterae.2
MLVEQRNIIIDDVLAHFDDERADPFSSSDASTMTNASASVPELAAHLGSLPTTVLRCTEGISIQSERLRASLLQDE